MDGKALKQNMVSGDAYMWTSGRFDISGAALHCNGNNLKCLRQVSNNVYSKKSYNFHAFTFESCEKDIKKS